MASKDRLTSVDAVYGPRPLFGQGCQCLAEFFREEFLKHHHCLEQQREYFSEIAIAQAEEALLRAMAQPETLH